MCVSDVCNTQDRECYFCGESPTIACREHYVFCPHCFSIYTQCMVKEECEHIKDHGVIPLRIGRKKTHKPFVIEKDGFQTCSICGREVVVDGW